MLTSKISIKNLMAVITLSLSLSGGAWAQGSRSANLAELAKYSGRDRERVLYEGAKKEGKLLWYTSLVPHKYIAKVFQAKYPGVAVDVYRAAGTTLAVRLLVFKRLKFACDSSVFQAVRVGSNS